MGLLRRYLSSHVAELHQNGVCLKVIGDRSRFSDEIVELFDRAEQVTAANRRLFLTMALNYGGRQEIVGAARRAVAAAIDADVDPATIDERAIEAQLETFGTPDPDLVIRTSGEMRISNFLLWQAAYAELVFTDTHMAGFRPCRPGTGDRRIWTPGAAVRCRGRQRQTVTNLQSRVVTGIGLAGLVIAAVLLGYWAFVAFVMAGVVIGAREWVRLVTGRVAWGWIAAVAGAASGARSFSRRQVSIHGRWP